MTQPIKVSLDVIRMKLNYRVSPVNHDTTQQMTDSYRVYIIVINSQSVLNNYARCACQQSPTPHRPQGRINNESRYKKRIHF